MPPPAEELAEDLIEDLTDEPPPVMAVMAVDRSLVFIDFDPRKLAEGDTEGDSIPIGVMDESACWLSPLSKPRSASDVSYFVPPCIGASVDVA